MMPPTTAAASLPSAAGLEAVAAEARATAEINFVGTALALAAFLPLLASSSKSPALHHLSSVAATIAAPSRCLYSATKAAALMAVESARVECEGAGVRFFCKLMAVLSSANISSSPGYDQQRVPNQDSILQRRRQLRGTQGRQRRMDGKPPPRPGEGRRRHPHQPRPSPRTLPTHSLSAVFMAIWPMPSTKAGLLPPLHVQARHAAEPHATGVSLRRTQRSQEVRTAALASCEPSLGDALQVCLEAWVRLRMA